MSDRPTRILVIKLGDLGDCLLATPALRALREARPNDTIELLAPMSARHIFGASNLIDRHLVLPLATVMDVTSRGLVGPLIVPAIAGVLQRRRYDVCIALQHLTTPAGIAKLAGLVMASGAKRRVGLNNGRGWFFTESALDQGFGAMHEADYWLSTVALLGADSAPRPTELPVSAQDHVRAENLSGQLPRPLIALHPGSGSYSVARRWPVERFAEVGRQLVARYGGSVVVIGNEGAINGYLATTINAIDLTGRLTVGGLAGLLGQVDLLVSNDSGVLHVGASARAPMVAIFGPTDARAWGPYFGRAEDALRAEIVHVPLGCRPCLYREHTLGWRDGCATRDCLALVTVEMVLEAASKLLLQFQDTHQTWQCAANR